MGEGQQGPKSCRASQQASQIKDVNGQLWALGSGGKRHSLWLETQIVRGERGTNTEGNDYSRNGLRKHRCCTRPSTHKSKNGLREGRHSICRVKEWSPSGWASPVVEDLGQEIVGLQKLWRSSFSLSTNTLLKMLHLMLGVQVINMRDRAVWELSSQTVSQKEIWTHGPESCSPWQENQKPTLRSEVPIPDSDRLQISN